MMPIYQDHDQDRLLLQKLREGCVESFNILYDKYWHVVYNGALKRLKDHAQVQDITQDIFAYLWLKKEELQIDNLPAYLHVSVRNRVLNIFEKERRYIPIGELLYNGVHLQSNHADALALQNEFLKIYEALVGSLPDQRKKIFKRYYEEGLSTEEIARQLSLSRKTVQNQLGRAASFLRTRLSQIFLLLMIICMYDQ